MIQTGRRKRPKVNRVDSHDMAVPYVATNPPGDTHPDNFPMRFAPGPGSAERQDIRVVRMCIYGEVTLHVWWPQTMAGNSIDLGPSPETRLGCVLHDSGPSGGATGRQRFVALALALQWGQRLSRPPLILVDTFFPSGLLCGS